MNKFGDLLREDLINPLMKQKDSDIDFGVYVDRYGKEFPGFIVYSEFCEIYMTHVFYSDVDNQLRQKPEDNMLRALFSALDADGRGRIARAQLNQFLQTRQPSATFLSRLKQKVRRGGIRFVSCLERDFQDVDVPFGANGLIPLPAFQKIMADYDLPFVSSDKPELEE